VRVHGYRQELGVADYLQQLQDVLVRVDRNVLHHHHLHNFEGVFLGYLLEYAFVPQDEAGEGDVEVGVVIVEVERTGH